MRHHADADLIPVLITSLRFHNFRNLGDATWEPGDGRHLLLGSNGAGKTSLLESIYLLATTRSFRTPRVEECCRRGRDRFYLEGSVEAQSRSELSLGWGATGRWRRLNGSEVPTSGYLEALPIVSWSARDLKVIEGSPGDRRRFLDQGIVSRRPAAVEVLARYRRALDQKRELLRRGAMRHRRDLLAWNELMADTAAELIERRAALVRELEEQVRQVVRESPLEVPDIELRYRSSPKLPNASREHLFEAFDSMKKREIAEGRVVAGPHRDEMEILWNGVEVAKIASAGEKKLLGILVCAARARMLSEVGRWPVVLLDDVDAELDMKRLAAVWNLFEEFPQVFASSCHGAIVGDLERAQIWRLESGQIAAG